MKQQGNITELNVQPTCWQIGYVDRVGMLKHSVVH